jgi:hypothetical protein
MQIAIDFIQGTNGAYLEYIGNTFLIPTVEFHNPFDDLDRSHNKQFTTDLSKFECGHYYLFGLPERFTDIIWIDISEQDLPRLSKIKQKKFGSDVLGYALDRPSYYDKCYKFPWKSFFDDSFYTELEKLCTHLNTEFSTTTNLRTIHSEFLQRHSYVL